jgi:intermediate peptidase
VENLFHEFGHAMHSALARTRYQHASGTRCQTDIAEIPSQWMEYFVYEPRVVKLFARHYQTGQTIPDDLLQRLHLAQNCFQAHRTQVQVYNSSTILSLKFIYLFISGCMCNV